jgi:DNA-damage-inducible protein D
MPNQLAPIQQNLENIKHTDKQVEYWHGRELMTQLGYDDWSSFLRIVHKAGAACENSGQALDHHFLFINQSPSDAEHIPVDVLLTRYACYLITQNADPGKPEVAASQTYFALQTRRRELATQHSREDRRLEARKSLRDTEGQIESTLYRRGIRRSADFSSFKNRHIKTLYGGLTVREVKEKRGIPTHRSLADFDSHLELRAKDFSLAMTDHNIKQKNIIGKQNLEKEVVENTLATRHTLIQRGIRPEELPAEEDLRAIEKRRQQKEMFLTGNLPRKLLSKKT